jgi:RNA polymerase sigma factor (sigma-70 family)
MDESPSTRRSLIIKLRDQADTAAWREFVDIYEPLVYRIARRKGLQDADAQDLCQDVFQSVARSIDRWDPARGGFRAWLSKITRNLLINVLSRAKYRPRGSGSSSVQDLLLAQETDDPSAAAIFDTEYRRRLFRWAAEQIRGEFAPSTWQAFWQTAVDGLPPKDVAAATGLSLGAIYVARSRVLSRLKKRIEHFGDDSVAIFNEVDDAFPAEPL